jgi:DNA end-binding protein Ku
MAELEQLEEQMPEEALSVPRTTWSGSVSIGLVNIPVKALAITKERRVSFRLLHRTCKTRISYKRFCQEGEEVPLSEIVFGYPLSKNRYIVLEKKEIEKAKPESKNRIRLDRFVNFFELDPHYFDITYLLVPNQSEEAYVLLRKVLELTGEAGIGKMTISSHEHVVLVHYYQKAIVATTLRYPDEVLSPKGMLRDLPEPGEEEMKLVREIVDGLSGDLDLSACKDQYRERVEALIKSKLGEAIAVKEGKKKAAKPAAKGLMETLRATAESLK